jgi:hypothetical protein
MSRPLSFDADRRAAERGDDDSHGSREVGHDGVCAFLVRVHRRRSWRFIEEPYRAPEWWCRFRRNAISLSGAARKDRRQESGTRRVVVC